MAFTRRHLPHWIPEETNVFVTWRLAGSLPPQAEPISDRSSGRLGGQASPKHGSPTGKTNRAAIIPADLRAQSGPTWLQDPRVARVVVNALLYGETVRRLYQLRAWVVMPNHAHAIFQPHTPMPAIMRCLKGRTSRVANRILGRTGTAFWQDESFDHWIRSGEELQNLIEYVENNPLKAGLVETKEQWPWSSAGWVTDDEKRSSVPPLI